MNAYIQKSLKYLIILGLMYMPIFGHLDTLPIRIWDESRLAINSYEMLQNRDYIVTHYDGKPDMWNTKPPLLIWIQVLFMKMFGVNEFSVRLPSAIAAFLTCITILFFSVRYLTNFWFGFIAVFVLMTSHGYINIHATRTGDYDALLTLFTTLSGLLFFVYCEKQNYKYLYLFFL
ncbi:MAG TPA: glycosyltransferase family 39 protein, partial [Bacteroidales bacterium]|nr:glycosyltransferase family 39 protein [Bacteroidales bacterium]